MFKLLITLCSVTLYLVSADIIDDFLGQDVIPSDVGNNFTVFNDVATDKPSHEDHHLKKVVSIVINPVIHNIANGYGGGGGSSGGGGGIGGGSQGSTGADTTPGGGSSAGQEDKNIEKPNNPGNRIPPVQLFAELIRVFFRKARFLTRFMFNGILALIRGSIRFIICTFIPICGLFSILGDEMDENPMASPEGVARGLDFIGGIIETYHSLRNSTIF